MPKRREGRPTKGKMGNILPPLAVEKNDEMRIKIFTIPITDDGTAQSELNRFLISQKILKVEQQFYSTPNGASWCFCVSYIPATKAVTGQTKNKKIDYKDVLSEKHFQAFSALREVRKMIAKEDAVPAYAVFTDAELSTIAQLENINEKSVLGIKGIADKRMQKYGHTLLARFKEKNSL